jgi:type IV pilus assembly protein PilO
MSTTAIVPPPNSSSLLRHVPKLTAQARALLTAVNLHFAGVAALGVLNLYLAIHLLFLVEALHSNNADAIAQQQTMRRAAEISALPLRGLDVKLVNSTADAEQFYTHRLPSSYSQVLSELGALTKQQNVHLNGVQYAQSPALSGPGQLIEVRMDASLAGDYRPLVQLINSLERDHMFFDISSITFTGANNGQVNLRMRINTYLRQPRPDEPLADTPQDGAAPKTSLPKPVTPRTPKTGGAR